MYNYIGGCRIQEAYMRGVFVYISERECLIYRYHSCHVITSFDAN